MLGLTTSGLRGGENILDRRSYKTAGRKRIHLTSECTELKILTFLDVLRQKKKFKKCKIKQIGHLQEGEVLNGMIVDLSCNDGLVLSPLLKNWLKNQHHNQQYILTISIIITIIFTTTTIIITNNNNATIIIIIMTNQLAGCSQMVHWFTLFMSRSTYNIYNSTKTIKGCLPVQSVVLHLPIKLLLQTKANK